MTQFFIATGIIIFIMVVFEAIEWAFRLPTLTERDDDDEQDLY